ncbi:hypothetical protein IJI72_00855 [Candidatus Saccharibacteria bacterium]|nr:hypothetical protein [Candidatus Saccharibacteria bacterium]
MSPKRKLKQRFYLIFARYFRFFANFSLKRWNPRIIAVTGSAGKTTMLNMLEFELGSEAHYSHDANSAFGIAFDLLGLRGITGSKLKWLFLVFAAPVRALYFSHKEPYYIVEIDGERPKETKFLASWLKPEMTLWISFGLSHAIQFEEEVRTGKFPTLEAAIADEFAELPRHTSSLVFIDADSEPMKKYTSSLPTKAKVIKIDKSAMKKYLVYPTRTEFATLDTVFRFPNPEPRDLAVQLLMLKELMKYLSRPLKTDFSAMSFPPGRSTFLEGKKGIKIIDSSYNAHLISMESILDMARSLHAAHKWLVIGDVVEQGSIEGAEHTRLADLIARVNPEEVILVGSRTKKYTAPRLKELGLSPKTTVDPKKALEYLETHLTGSETVIFKGSQYLEWLIEKLLKNPEDAGKLCRREPAAKKRREKKGLY